MYTFPEPTIVNKVLAKTKIYDRGRPNKAVCDLFVSEVGQILWKNKLSPDTLNLPSANGIQEIQVFEIALRRDAVSLRVLQTIDRAIPYPVFYRLRRADSIQVTAAYKRPAQDGTAGWVLGDYYHTDWIADKEAKKQIPVSLNLGGLYEQMMHTLIALPPRKGELLATLVERNTRVRKLRSQLTRLTAKMKAEKQFNRKVDHHAQIRGLRAELNQLLEV